MHMVHYNQNVIGTYWQKLPRKQGVIKFSALSLWLSLFACISCIGRTRRENLPRVGNTNRRKNLLRGETTVTSMLLRLNI
jgi:hypothetical protein